MLSPCRLCQCYSKKVPAVNMLLPLGLRARGAEGLETGEKTIPTSLVSAVL
jgi:hypothetical protein